MDLYEHQGKELFRRFGIPVSDGRRRDDAGGGARRGRRSSAGAVVVKAQVLTGGRGKAGGVKLADDADEAEAEGARDPRARHPRARRRAALDRARRRDREGVLPLGHVRPRREQAAADAHDARAASRSSRSRPRRPRRSRACTSTRSRATGRTTAAAARRRDRRRRRAAADRRDRRAALPLLRRDRRDALRDQPADRHARRRGARARREGHDRRLGALPAPRPRASCATRARPTRSRRSRARRASPTSSSTARSGSSATAPGSRWRPSTSSSSPAAGRRTSATSAAAARPQGVVDALEVIARDAQVRSILFNIFGGITRCDEVARGILAALERIEIAVPIVVRLDGTNAEEGRRILADAAPPSLHVEPTMLDAARRAVELAGMTRRPGASAPSSTATSTAHSRGADLDLVVEWAAGLRDGDRRRDRRRARRAAAARGRARGRELRPGAGDAARRHLLRRGPAVRRRELRPRGHAASPRTTSPTSRRRSRELGARRARARGRRRQPLPWATRVEEAEKLRDPSHVRNYTEAEWRGFFDGAGLDGRGGAHLRLPDRARAVARAHRLHGRGRRRACASCSPTGSTAATSCSTASPCARRSAA